MSSQSIRTKAEYWLVQDLEFARKAWLGLNGRKTRMMLAAAVAGQLMGFLFSYAFQPTYTSQALVSLDSPARPRPDSQSSIQQDVGQRITRVPQELDPSRLEAVVETNRRAKTAQSADQIHKNMRIYLAGTNSQENDTDSNAGLAEGSQVANYYVEYSGATPTEAQQICDEVTAILLQENLNSWQPLTETLGDTLRQLNEVKRNLDEKEAKLTGFKRAHIAELSDEQDENDGVLLDLNAHLKRITESIKLAQDNQSRTQSLLAQEQAKNRRPQPTRVSTAALDMQLSRLQSQLLQLQAQYADDHPDVVKTKSEIAEIQRKLAPVNVGEMEGAPNTNSNDQESPEIRKLRSEIEHDRAVIADGKGEEKRIQAQIDAYERRQTVSASAEGREQRLQQEYKEGQNSYAELLAKKRDIDNKMDGNAAQSTAMIRMLRPPSLPVAPSFPNRLLFAATGLFVSVVGCSLVLTLPPRKKH
jgi:polysaccharide biosynthesis transport protein